MYPGTINNNQSWGVSLLILYYKPFLDLQEQNFNIFTGHDNEPIISFDPSSTLHENGMQNFDNGIDCSGVEVLSKICQQVRDFHRMVST